MDGYGTAFRRAALLSVLASLAVAAPASADWVEPVTAPLNDPAAPVVYAPSIAGDGTTTYAALEEQSANGVALDVLQLGGSAWQSVGGPLATGSLVGPPRIADVAGTVYVVWTQASSEAVGSPGPNQVFVDYLSNGSWQPAGKGQPLNLSAADDASAPSIAAVGNTPYVAFVDGAFSPSGDRRVVVEQYNTGPDTWTRVGTPLIDVTGDTATDTSLASAGGVPYVAWSESNATSSSEIDVAEDPAGTWTKTAGTTSAVVSPSGDSLIAPELAAAGSTVYLAYGDTNNSTDTANAYVLEYNGATLAAGRGLGERPHLQPSIPDGALDRRGRPDAVRRRPADERRLRLAGARQAAERRQQQLDHHRDAAHERFERLRRRRLGGGRGRRGGGRVGRRPVLGRLVRQTTRSWPASKPTPTNPPTPPPRAAPRPRRRRRP